MIIFKDIPIIDGVLNIFLLKEDSEIISSFWSDFILGAPIIAMYSYIFKFYFIKKEID
jgi:hypothetical protein